MAHRRKRARPNTTRDGRRCAICNTDDTPQWRKVVREIGVLDACNRCGIGYADLTKRLRRDPTDGEVDAWKAQRLQQTASSSTLSSNPSSSSLSSLPITEDEAALILVAISTSPVLEARPHLPPSPLRIPLSPPGSFSSIRPSDAATESLQGEVRVASALTSTMTTRRRTQNLFVEVHPFTEASLASPLLSDSVTSGSPSYEDILGTPYDLSCVLPLGIDEQCRGSAFGQEKNVAHLVQSPFPPRWFP